MSRVERVMEQELSTLLDDRTFLELDARYRKFNLFSALGIVRNELRHSNFLKFLLSPAESHGLGATILTPFLRLLLSKCKPETRNISSLELLLADLDSAIVERERDNIDILIEVKPLKLVVAIENKVGSPVRDGQLTGYKEIVKRKYGGWHQLFVLLTAEGYDPGEYDLDYIALGYGEMLELLTGFIEERRTSLSSEMTLILGHCIETLRSDIVEDEKLAELARQLYYKHKSAFEFVFRNRPNLLDPIRSLVETDDTFVVDRSNPMLFRFAPREWGAVVQLNSCPLEKWTRTGRNLLFEAKAYRNSERISVGLVLGPADAAFRAFAYSSATKKPSIFRSLVKPMGQVFSTIYTRDLLSAAAAENLDQDEKMSTIKSGWEIFANEDLPRLKSEVADIVRGFEQESSNRGLPA